MNGLVASPVRFYALFPAEVSVPEKYWLLSYLISPQKPLSGEISQVAMACGHIMGYQCCIGFDSSSVMAVWP